MLSFRTIVLSLCLVFPVLLYLGLGAYALWRTGLFVETFWILPGFWIVTAILAAVWKPMTPGRRQVPPAPGHFTPRDEAALEIVARYQREVDQLTPEQLTDPQFYLQLSQRMAREIALHYHPKAKDPISDLTVPEVLAAMRLAVDDMERWMLDSVPGSRMITIRQWRWLEHAPKWTRRLQNAVWVGSVLLNPANILKYLTSQVTMGPISDELQSELLAVVYLRYVRQTGFYLVEMNSGRLRGGADMYRRTFGGAPESDMEVAPQTKPQQPSINSPVADAAGSIEGRTPPASESVTVALVGQVKAGKSSLVNALLGRQAAASDVLPETRTVARYEMSIPDSPARLTLLDTPGYADAGATRAQMEEMRLALRSADVVLWVMDAHSPARQADRDVVDELQRWFRDHPAFRPPPVILCLTHIDLLSPVMEWDPPYNWRDPQSRKEHSIAGAVAYVRDKFGDLTTAVAPLCTDVERGRDLNVMEELAPLLAGKLREGQTVALLRAYDRELSADRWKTVWRQMKGSGKSLWKAWLEERGARWLPPGE